MNEREEEEEEEEERGRSKKRTLQRCAVHNEVDDEVVLQCVACIQKENRKFCLAAEGLGNRLCYLEPTSEAKASPTFGINNGESCACLFAARRCAAAVRSVCSAAVSGLRVAVKQERRETTYVPPDLCICTFVLEQSLSVRALQEMLAKSGQNTEGSECWNDGPVSSPLADTGARNSICRGKSDCMSLSLHEKVLAEVNTQGQRSAQSGGHKTLLYGHAILLRHSFSSMYLACLKTSRSQTDKLSFDVGLQEDSTGEACWWTIHPASKQRSEGEKVRIGDDLILVSVSSERYLQSASSSFTTCLFPRCLAHSTVHNLFSVIHERGYLLGGHVMRLFHGHDEVVAIPGSDQTEEQQRIVNYETGKAGAKARSLWRLEPLRISWSGSHIRWGQPFRLRHLTTGHYLALTEDRGLVLQDRERSDTIATAYCFRASKEKLEQSPKRDIEGMGLAEIKYGDSLCFIMHVATGLWLSYQAPDVKSARLGPLKRRACLHSEGHMDDGLTLQRCQHEESRAARIIRNTTLLFKRFIR
ncbi:Ryanodine receptor 3 [Liparis tanakae]|uniref:Ryanodine receptor 3 n=1 Tax=Liparis tanakae TaxID=230148 RepID=A0A4Z2JB71_9TELE|nr:Ryanodine receptor 3 [Liparis tanakae]